MRAITHLLSLFDFPTILAGHGYDVGGPSQSDSAGDDDSAGIGLPWMIAILVLTATTIGVLVSLSPGTAAAKIKGVAPVALVAVLIAGPLVAWTVLSRGGQATLIVERAIGLNGAPELIVSLGDAAVNTLETTDGRPVVRVACVARDGQRVLEAEQKWPFPVDPNYRYPHAHQGARRDQLQRVDRCSVEGTRVRLEASVKGALAP